MVARNSDIETCNQDKIWDYFQNNALEAFKDAKPRLDFIIKQISRKTISAAPCILNIGVGSGYLEETAQQRGWKIHSLDPNEKTIKRLIEKGIKGRKGYIEQIPFDNETFDFVIASEVLEHLTDEQRRRGILEVSRILNRGGWFIGTVPFCEDLSVNYVICPRCREVFHRWGHQKSFELKTLSDELSQFLEVMEVRRTAFVDLHERPLVGKIKSLLRLFLAKYGEMIASPSIYFCTRKL